MDEPLLVLVPGAGHTAAVWDATRASLRTPSIAVDLPGRGARPAALATVTPDEAAAAVVEDVVAAVADDPRPVVVVGHSVAGTILPRAAVALAGRDVVVRRLVFVAGISAAEGVRPVEVFMPGRVAEADAHLAQLRRTCAGRTLEELDVKVASGIDSLNFSCRPMRWADLPASVPRAFVRCLGDPIQSRELQAAFIASCGADVVVDVDSGHTPAIDAPEALARILDDLA